VAALAFIRKQGLPHTSLRALWQHPPYFHDGSTATLADVVAQYNLRLVSPQTSSEIWLSI
jgi:cytochrome c peroxidase